MITLRTCNNRGKLRGETKLAPVIDQETRWSSTFNMIERYLEFVDLKIDFKEIDASIVELKKGELKQLEKVYQSMKDIDSVTKKLQHHQTNLLKGHVLFLALKANFKFLKNALTDEAGYRHKASIKFESGVIKVQDGKEYDLDEEEREALEPFLLEVVEVENRPSKKRKDPSTFADDALNAHETKRTEYRDLSYIPNGSVIAERLFSRAKFVVTDDRANLDPDSVEGILFLRYNKDFWGVKEIEQLIVEKE